MYAFLVSSEIMLSSLMLFTFLACVLLTFMHHLSVLSEITLSIYLVFASLHGYFFPLCIACWCWVRQLIVVSWYIHKHTQKHFICLFPAWVLLSLMYGFLVSSEIMLSSRLLFTFLTCVLLTFMHRLSVLSEITLSICWSHSLHGQFLPSCTACWCWVRLCLAVAYYSHSLHVYFLPMYGLLVVSETTLCSRLLSHSLYGYFLPSCTACCCWVRFLFVVAWYSHSLHGYYLPSCTACWCWVRVLFVVVWYSHSLHASSFLQLSLAGVEWDSSF